MALANCNWWQYSRWTYLLGRSVKYQTLTVEEKEAVIAFINSILESRISLIPRINLKKGDVAEISVQNEYNLGKMLQIIGRQLKVTPPTEEEKELCDALFEKIANKYRIPGWEAIIPEEEPNDPGSESEADPGSGSSSESEADPGSGSASESENTDPGSGSESSESGSEEASTESSGSAQ